MVEPAAVDSAVQSLNAACRLAHACFLSGASLGDTSRLLRAAPLLLGSGRQLLASRGAFAPGSNGDWTLWRHLGAALGLAQQSLLDAPDEVQSAAFPPGETVLWLEALLQCVECLTGELRWLSMCMRLPLCSIACNAHGGEPGELVMRLLISVLDCPS